MQRLVAAQPELKNQPILLHQRDTRRGLRVVACSTAARRLGVQPHMPITEAAALLQRGTGGRVANAHSNSSSRSAEQTIEQHPGIQAHDTAADRKTLTELAVWCQQFSPLVGWETVAAKTLERNRPRSAGGAGEKSSVDFLLLDIAGLGALFGSEAELAERVAAAMRRRGYYPSVAIASNIAAAWALARHGRFTQPALPRRQVWFPEDETQQLGRLPIAALRVADDVVQTLQRLGVSRVQQLEQLPRSGLRSRFGPELLLRLEQLRGEATETLVPYQPPDAFTAVWECDPPTSRRDNLEEAVRRLTGQVADLLRRCDRGAIRLLCRIHQQAGEPQEPDRRKHQPAGRQQVLQVELFQPTCNGNHLFELLRMQLEQVRLPTAATRIELNAALAAPLEVRQEELFQDGSRHRTRQFSMLLNRLSVRLGGERVLRPRRTADPQPERSCLLEPAHHAPRSRRRGKQRSAAAKRQGAVHRPLKLYEPPRRIETTAVVPDGPPIRFEAEKCQHQVARHWGPERIETGWWRGPSVRRDYYRVETKDGRRFWVFRELNDNHWFLHGVFD